MVKSIRTYLCLHIDSAPSNALGQARGINPGVN